MSTTIGKCSICQKSLYNDNKIQVTASCGHKFHRECTQQRFIKWKSNECPICRRESALSDVFASSSMIRNNQDRSGKKTYNEKIDHVASGRNKSRSSDAKEKEKNENQWQCLVCSMKNSASSRQCQTCDVPKTSSSSIIVAPKSTKITKQPSDEKSSVHIPV
ncbi:unnamed protein product [Rotaria magnacalcarata]|uniref:RanBP-type and C3HC4-type zinc finger-containing protein 1 n=3 Tax=Rotaria magnacalcarata TaxID=392030 RepID=A0A815BWT7_9BILA|nr:unnamed protein product [Rotaria magnacalcarata]CAF4152090.1 unnamed protein product [Rotaria magnacalcarata]CAF4216141.1 unnamed protein product [Rotaria magnacalcarata]